MMTSNDSSADQIRAACAAAAAAAPAYAALPVARRAALLRALADALQAERDPLVALADRETALGPVRLNGELDRTCFQLRGFADQVDQGAAQPVQDDPAVAGAPPAGRPHLTRVHLPLGPVAMFAASNFPFAFSVLGGDTAAALAAGCPVVVKSHPGHPQLSNAVLALASACLAALDLPAGVLQAVQGAGTAVGVALVRDPAIEAVAFTGSQRGGVALWHEANARPRPIPFYGELGSINPVVALPEALAAQGQSLASALAASITLGCGQFCTSPGVLLLRDDASGQAFVRQLGEALALSRPHAMLHPGIRAGFDAGVARLASHPGVATLLAAPAQGAAPGAHLFATDAARFCRRCGLARRGVRPGLCGGLGARPGRHPACAAGRAGQPDRDAVGGRRRHRRQPPAGAGGAGSGRPGAVWRPAHWCGGDGGAAARRPLAVVDPRLQHQRGLCRADALSAPGGAAGRAGLAGRQPGPGLIQASGAASSGASRACTSAGCSAARPSPAAPSTASASAALRCCSASRRSSMLPAATSR